MGIQITQPLLHLSGNYTYVLCLMALQLVCVCVCVCVILPTSFLERVCAGIHFGASNGVCQKRSHVGKFAFALRYTSIIL